MVFVIPEERERQANIAAGNLANMYSQYQGSQELQKALGLDDSINLANLSPAQQQTLLDQRQKAAQLKSEQDLMNYITNGEGGFQQPAGQNNPQQPQQPLNNQQAAPKKKNLLQSIMGLFGGGEEDQVQNQEQTLVEQLSQQGQPEQQQVPQINRQDLGSQIEALQARENQILEAYSPEQLDYLASTDQNVKRQLDEHMQQKQVLQAQVQQLQAQEQSQQPQQQQPQQQPQQQQPQQQPQPQQQDPNRFSREKVAAISIKHPKVAAIIQSQNKADDARFTANANRHWDVAKKVFEEADKSSDGLIVKENALSIQRKALEDRGMIGFTQDLLAKTLGSDLLVSPQGALINTAGKEFLLGNIKRAGARPNQWIEEQISKALVNVGKTDEANFAILEIQELENRIERRKLELIPEVADSHEREFGFVKRSLGADVEKALKRYSVSELEITEQRLRDSAEASNPETPQKREVSRPVPEGRTRVILPDGSPGTIPNDQLEAFIQAHNAEVVK